MTKNASKINKNWKKRPPGSNWGDWGEDNHIGRLNLITSDKVLQGIAEVKTGKTFCLSLPLNYPGDNVVSAVRFPPQLKPVIRNNTQYYNFEWRQVNPNFTDIASDDIVVLYNQYSTQWDSLAHRGCIFDINDDGNPVPVYYNGFRAGEDVIMNAEKSIVSAKALGIEHMAMHGVQGRGVLIDLYSEYGKTPRKEVRYEDLMQCLEKQNVTVEKGDILCLWTGLDEVILRMKGKPNKTIHQSCAVLDGHDKKLLQWITDSGIAAIASDNVAIEAVGKKLPDDYCGSILPLHEHCLVKLGVHLGELWYLSNLAKWLKKNKRNRFLLTAPPLRLTGAVGSPVTPIATV